MSPPTHSTLILGRTRTTLGQVVSGNLYRGEEKENEVFIDLGDLKGGGEFAEISFVVEVDEVIGALNEKGGICTQGIVWFAESDSRIVTDDPNTAVWDDPTCSHISASPSLVVTQT